MEEVEERKFPDPIQDARRKEQMMIYNEEAGNEVHTVQVSLEDREEVVFEQGECVNLAEMGLKKIEDYFGMPMDIEWAKDGISGELFIVEARPETIHSKAEGSKMMLYKIDEKLTSKLKKDGRVLAERQAVGRG